MSAKDGVAVVGGGAWGIGLAAAAARTGKTVLILSRKGLDGALPDAPIIDAKLRDVVALVA